MKSHPNISRRSFVKKSASTLALLGTAPMIVPHHVIGQTPPSEQLTVGVIGLGCRGIDHVIACLRNENIRLTALADVDLAMLNGGLELVDTQMGIDRAWTQRRNGWMTIRLPLPEGGVEPFMDYRKLLERKDIDAVAVATPDHWHAKVFIDAMQAGKHVYGEKPLAQTIVQGRKIVDTSKDTGRVFQTGLQQRSHYNFQRACELVRNGYLGKIDRVLMRVGGVENRAPEPDGLAPGGLDYEMWLGPAPLRPYNPLRSHFNFRWFFDYAGGKVTDIGAHECDIAQWALGMDHTGPQSVSGWAKPPGGAYDTFGTFEFTLTYTNGSKLIFSSDDGFDMRFYGEKGELFVNRATIESSPAEILNTELRASDERFVPEGSERFSDEGYGESTRNHFQNWVDAIKNDTDPICPAEVGHRTTTLCHIANICGLVGRELKWDPEKERFDDREANRYLDVEQREPYAV